MVGNALTAIPANVDIATQEILELAIEFDPCGDRTLGVFTKPHLVDDGAEKSILDMLKGRTQGIKLGGSVVRNPGQRDLDDNRADRNDGEISLRGVLYALGRSMPS
ncbi:hypothetical protein EMCG_03756 [[Emmonsia] crescens]|uniref:Uncharacterized protein n=1 Tax=[Emmonsia] crescens TaxID=73230 RepID=A0A0G2HU71_9EURO|nr:hypothetical protein EMCG_03756 [Emmonsia crescens UAMH 3008]